MANIKIPFQLMVFAASVFFVSGFTGETGSQGKPAVQSNADHGSLYFDFGRGDAVRGFLKVKPEDFYSEGSGFGLLASSPLWTAETDGPGPPGNKPQDRDCIVSDDPFLFLCDVPEGNYNVNITAGGVAGDSRLTLKAESRRLMAMNLLIPRGETRTIGFTTNVRYPELESGERVRLKSRENGHLNWDRRLSVEFSGENIAIYSVEITRNGKALTVFLAGNSTVTDQRYEPYSAWGQMLPVFFKTELVSVANHAESGEALKSFISEKRLEKLMGQVRPGDYLFIQFAHNDQKTQSSAYSAPFSDYQDHLRLYIRETRERGATPVLVTPMLRRNFDDQGHVVNTHGDYPAAMREVAEGEMVALIDLFEMSRLLYEALGPEGSKKLFVHYPAGSFPGQGEELKDNSHHSTYGAYELARCIVQGIREEVPELAVFLVDGLPVFDPSKPDPYDDWYLPVSPAIDPKTPEGR